MHRHLPGLQPQPGRDRRAQREDALTVTPHGDGLAVPAGDRAARRHRRVGQERPGELGGQRAGGRARGVPARLVHHRLLLRRRREQEPPHVARIGQRRGRLPARRTGDPPGGPQRGPVGRSHHAEERAVPHQHHLAAQIQVGESGQVGGPRGRPHHPAVGHARQDQIVQEPRDARSPCPGCPAAGRCARRRTTARAPGTAPARRRAGPAFPAAPASSSSGRSDRPGPGSARRTRPAPPG